MCGIAGLFNYGAAVCDETERVTRMRDAMRHRGPDGAGLYRSPDRRVVLAHRRLSIVDLSARGQQPMTNESGDVWITFNGEIYNQLALRERLEQSGHQFGSRTDTEAIVHLYEELGRDCVPRLDGMFAFAIWDAKEQRLLLVRDRLGKKPLYYTVIGSKLLFASEIKALLQHPEVTRELDREGLDYFLTFSNVPAPYTLFSGIRKLPAAHWLECDMHGEIRVERFWSPVADARSWRADVSEAEASETVHRLLRQAVKKRLMSDVPVGAFLSGGIDSSSNVALMSELMSDRLHTFSASFTGFGDAENFHDIPYARKVAAMYGCQHQEVEITADDCKACLPDLALHQDEPIADPACLPMYFVSKAARAGGVVVVLVGEGSDEVFGGYPDFVHLSRSYNRRWRPLLTLPRFIREGLYQSARALGRGDGSLDVLRRAAENEPFYWGLTIAFWETEKRRLIQENGHVRSTGRSAAIVKGYYDELHAVHPHADFLQQVSFVELSNRLPELLLMRVDKFSMAHSLEARAPFLDYELASYALSLPAHLKIAGTRTKHILKEALRGVLPAEIIDRPKQGFRVPLPDWLAGELRPWAEQILFDSPLRSAKLLNFDYVRWMWDRHVTRTWDHSFDLWCLMNLSAWYEQWFC